MMFLDYNSYSTEQRLALKSESLSLILTMQLFILLIQNKCSPIPMNVQAQLNYSHGYFVKFPHWCTPIGNPHH